MGCCCSKVDDTYINQFGKEYRDEYVANYQNLKEQRSSYDQTEEFLNSKNHYNGAYQCLHCNRLYYSDQHKCFRQQSVPVASNAIF